MVLDTEAGHHHCKQTIEQTCQDIKSHEWRSLKVVKPYAGFTPNILSPKIIEMVTGR